MILLAFISYQEIRIFTKQVFTGSFLLQVFQNKAVRLVYHVRIK